MLITVPNRRRSFSGPITLLAFAGGLLAFAVRTLRDGAPSVGKVLGTLAAALLFAISAGRFRLARPHVVHGLRHRRDLTRRFRRMWDESRGRAGAASARILFHPGGGLGSPAARTGARGRGAARLGGRFCERQRAGRRLLCLGRLPQKRVRHRLASRAVSCRNRDLRVADKSKAVTRSPRLLSTAVHLLPTAVHLLAISARSGPTSARFRPIEAPFRPD
jgi:hypothetical protein